MKQHALTWLVFASFYYGLLLWVQPIWAIIGFGAGLTSIALYCYDKQRAIATAQRKESRNKNFAYRVPEKWFHRLSSLGGWPLAGLAQAQFRHKTMKAEFQRRFYTAAIIHIIATLLLSWPTGRLKILQDWFNSIALLL